MNSLNDIWKAVIDVLSTQFTQTAITTWFSDCVPVDIDGTRMVIQTTTDFKRSILVSRFSESIKAALSDIFSCEFDLLILAGDEIEEYSTRKKEESTLPEMAGYTFDNFIVGNSNRFAHSAALAVAQNPGSAYNPLFIYGNSGLGKTHLLLSIGHAIHEKDPSKKIAYIKGDEFTNQLIRSIREGKAEEFRNKYRNVDLFLVDDIQFIAGKEATQNEFFHTFNNIYEAGHQIVITSDRPPMEMSLLEDRLRTRFEGGLMADIEPPDIETRKAITRNKAAQLGLVLDDEAANLISEKLSSNVRQIEGVVKRLTAYKEILGKTITKEDAMRAIQDVIKNGTYIPSPERIIQETARYYSLTEKDLRGQNRSKNIALARQVSMYIMRTLTDISLTDIGSEYEDRNHATVLSSIRKVEDLLKTDQTMVNAVRDITSNINSY